MKKKYLILLLIFFFVFIYILINFDFWKKKTSQSKTLSTIEKTEITTEKNYSSNKMNEVSYASKDLKGEKENIVKKENTENSTYNSNIIKNIKYITKDVDGNEYIINAKEAETDISNRNVLYLKDVSAVIKLNNSGIIRIVSDYGKYNSNNYDTIFSKNVIITYLDNIIKGKYLDFSWDKNLIIISRDVTLNNNQSSLRADVIEVDIKKKDIKIFMYEENKKVNVKSKNYTNGNN